MEENRFEQILDYLCSGIMSKSEKQCVRDELYDHLMCKYEINLAVGLDEEQAEKKAVEELGDASTLRFKLGQVHSYAPKPTLKKAMNLLIFGYVLTSFHISLFAGMKEITTFIGSVCMIVALFCLGKANNKIRLSFFAKTTASVLAWLAYAVEPIYSLPFELTAAVGIINNLLSPIYMILLILGLKELANPYIGGYPKMIPFDAAAFFNGFMGLINVVLFGFIIDDGDLNAEFESIILFGIMVICIVLNLVVFVRSSKLFWNSDHEYKIGDSSAKKKIAVFLAIIIAVVPTVAVDLALATQKAETSAYSIEDYDMLQSEYERICTNLLSYGIPEKVVYSLPKSEITKYSKCINMSDYSAEMQKFLEDTVSQYYTNVCNDVEIGFSTCAIGITDETGYPYVRVLSWIEYLSEGKGYDDAVFWDYSQTHFLPLNYDEEYEGDFLLILSDEDGKIMKNEPLDIYTDENALTDRMTGVRFESKKDLLIIHAETLQMAERNGNTLSNYLFELSHRNSPFTFYYRSPLSAKENGVYWDAIGYRMTSAAKLISWAYPEDEFEEYEITEDF